MRLPVIDILTHILPRTVLHLPCRSGQIIDFDN